MQVVLLSVLAVVGAGESASLSGDRAVTGSCAGGEHCCQGAQCGRDSAPCLGLGDGSGPVSAAEFILSHTWGRLAKRRMYRYPPACSRDYRRAYDYRLSFDYPWDAGPHAPTCSFSNGASSPLTENDP